MQHLETTQSRAGERVTKCSIQAAATIDLMMRKEPSTAPKLTVSSNGNGTLVDGLWWLYFVLCNK